MNMPEPGTYDNVMAGKRGLKTSSNGNLELVIECLLEDNTSILAFLYLTKSNGAVLNERQIDDLKALLPDWDGADLDYLADESAEWPLFQIVVEDEEYNGQTKRKVKWLNPNGSTGGGGGVQQGDMNEIKSRFGAMFRANAGPKRRTASAPKSPPKSPPKSKAAPKPPAAPDEAAPDEAAKPTATQQEVWEAVCAEHEGKPEAEIQDVWFKLLKTMNKEYQEITPEEWGQLKRIATDDLPF